MILQQNNIEFHNVGALEALDGISGLSLVRIPQGVRETLNYRARLRALSPTGVELRFVTEAPQFRLSLAAHEGGNRLHVFRGGYGHSEHGMGGGTTRVFDFAAPETFSTVTSEGLKSGVFSPDVWRIQISGGPTSFWGFDSIGFPVRPPTADEKPALRWLAYGSSITHASVKGYPHRAAHRLGVDVLNKGFGGACHCEETLADYFASEETWDFATLELGINMRGTFPVEEFERRARYLVRRLRDGKPGAPIVLLTHFLNRTHHIPPEQHEDLIFQRQTEYDHVLRAIASEMANEGVHLIEGCDVLTDFCGLSCDLIHPSEAGHLQMGENLARLLEPIIAPLRIAKDEASS
ncbi:SGNH/GDSL hydrolase family protein [Puniceicoccus vermicola]|uniref:Lipase n=1 Tax=Puniceicoccus vermicola TaxID=388746 RepID=A0A7X1E5K6_9BACT|nr:GDSL-type esterase/lipase family protein [Puniceicoccus vermicola]MBC2603244.1 lipase [Puniceicoccus vermicola]